MIADSFSAKKEAVANQPGQHQRDSRGKQNWIGVLGSRRNAGWGTGFLLSAQDISSLQRCRDGFWLLPSGPAGTHLEKQRGPPPTLSPLLPPGRPPPQMPGIPAPLGAQPGWELSFSWECRAGGGWECADGGGEVTVLGGVDLGLLLPEPRKQQGRASWGDPTPPHRCLAAQELKTQLYACQQLCPS